jgi:hypothetical protein
MGHRAYNPPAADEILAKGSKEYARRSNTSRSGATC